MLHLKKFSILFKTSTRKSNLVCVCEVYVIAGIDICMLKYVEEQNKMEKKKQNRVHWKEKLAYCVKPWV